MEINELNENKIISRIKNPLFWGVVLGTLVPQIIIFYDLPILEDYRMWLEIITAIFAGLGIYINPTTRGLKD